MKKRADSRDVLVLGTNHRTAEASVREALAFSEPEAAAFLRRAASQSPQAEAVLLSTCNRTELYVADPQGVGAMEAWASRLCAFRGGPLGSDDYPLYRLGGIDAVRHLFRVACGLDSAVLGDVQILGQVRRAMATSAESGSLGKHLQKAFALAVDTGSQARRDTSISRGEASIGSALAGILAERLTSARLPPKILVLGAGEMARDVARQLTKRDLGTIRIANRTAWKARALAAEHDASAVRWSDLWEAVSESDIVVAATSSRKPILARERTATLVRERNCRLQLVIDLGMPRNVEPGTPVDIIDIDAIRERHRRTLSLREAAVPAVERIVSYGLLLWEQWLESQLLEHSLKALYSMAGRASEEAAEELLRLEHGDKTVVKKIVLRSIKRVLHQHVRSLRAHAQGGTQTNLENVDRGFAETRPYGPEQLS